MQYQKRAGFIAAALCFMFFAACESERRVSNSSEENPFVQISILRMDLEKIRLGESRTIPVTARNTDFTLSSPPDAGCVKNGSQVICTPISEGKYEIKVTATADTKKSAATTITVEFVSIAISPASAIVKKWESAEFRVAANGPFALSATNQSRHDANCETISNYYIICEPYMAGTYAITVTAADGTSDTAILTTLIEISPLKQSVKAKEGIAVFEVNATDFTVSANPTDITCIKNGSEVACVPDGDGAYVITVTLNDENSNKVNKDEALLIGIKD